MLEMCLCHLSYIRMKLERRKTAPGENLMPIFYHKSETKMLPAQQ